MTRDMKTFAFRILVAALLLMCVAGSAVAQELKLVSGKVLSKPEMGKAAPYPSTETVRIFAFNTVAAAKDGFKVLEAGGLINGLGEDNATKAEADGSYEILVAENGALIIYVGLNKRLEEVKYRTNIPIVFNDAQQLGNVLVQGDAGKKPKAETEITEMIGNQLVVKGNFTFAGDYLASNKRVIVQPYVIDCQTEEVITNINPIVFDGAEYSLTQDRRMMEHDLLAAFISRDSSHTLRFGETVYYTMKDTVTVPNPNRRYSARSKVVICDYTQNTFEDDWQLTSCRLLRPMEFLEYSLPDYGLDPNKYKEQPKIEKCDTEGDISLSFVVNKAELDSSDPNNEIQMEKLRSDLMGIINGEGTTLKEFKITGVSSPEGGYQRNLALSKLRTDYALRQITSMIPAAKWARVYKHPTEARVATWNEVADLLEKDTLLNETAEVREITAKYELQDAQYAAIRKLPYYETAIKNTFPRLRTVKYKYRYDIFRELNPDEIVQKYYENKQRRFTKYEYWHLFQQIKDPVEAEKIYRQAYKDHMSSDGKPWLLAANNLAVALLKRDTFDVEVLKPLIDYTKRVNMTMTYDDGFETIVTEVNPENVVANQLAMYIRAYNFKEASILSQMLPNTDKFKMVKAFSSCLGGRYNYKKARTENDYNQFLETFNLVKNSSPINHVVICMAMREDNFDREAMEVLETIPLTTKTKYLKLQLYYRMNNIKNFQENYTGYYYTGDPELEILVNAYQMLDEIVKEDAKFKNIAINDGEFSEEFVKHYIDADLRKKLQELYMPSY